MTLSERALSFAIRAHEGQYRKSEMDKPYVIHPLIVGSLLKKYGYDDKVVAAGYLHDIVEETEYTIEDISRLFGGEVASLVMTATEADQSLPWKERKTQQIKAVANLPERNAAIICADKIANIEDLRIERKKKGGIDYSNFHADEMEQKWFFTSMCEALSKIIDSPMTDRFYNSICDVFDNYIDYNSDDYFEYQRMNTISGYQEDLMKLKTVIGDSKPYIIEFAGTPKSGKSSMIRLLNDFFTNAEFRVRVFEEKPSINRYGEAFISNKASISTVEKNLLVSSAIEEDLMEQIVGDQDIVMVENSLFDSLVLVKILLDRGKISSQEFEAYLNHYMSEIESLINYVVISYSGKEKIKERIKNETLSYGDMLERNDASLMYDPYEYNRAMSNFASLINHDAIVDTTKLTAKESSLIVAEKLLPIMRKEYVLRLKKYLDTKREAE